FLDSQEDEPAGHLRRDRGLRARDDVAGSGHATRASTRTATQRGGRRAHLDAALPAPHRRGHADESQQDDEDGRHEPAAWLAAVAGLVPADTETGQVGWLNHERWLQPGTAGPAQRRTRPAWNRGN